MPKTQAAPPRPPGTDAIFNVTCKDVVMGRGSGTQNHCGNVTYRKLVYLNKELYATASKFDKLKISKAIVAAVRLGGHFVQADDKRGGLYYDIGDKRAWDKTSQALREGQAEVRARLAEEDPEGLSKVAEHKKVINDQTFLAYACMQMENLYAHSEGGACGAGACGQQCPHAQRRKQLNQTGADPMTIHNAMQNLHRQQLGHTPPPQGMGQTPPPLPPPQAYGAMNNGMQQQQYSPAMQQQQYSPGMQQYHQQQYSPGMGPTSVTPNANPNQPNINSIEPLPFNGRGISNSYEPLPYAPGPANAPGYNSHPPSLAPTASSTPTPGYRQSMDPLPYTPSAGNVIPRPGPMMMPMTTEGSAGSGGGGSVFSLRHFVSEDFQMSSDEGKMLMDQLNQEVDDLIRRKSKGLIQIDTRHAFEDLVFEEDSMERDGGPRREDPVAVAATTTTDQEVNLNDNPSTQKKRGSASTHRSSGISRGTGKSGVSMRDDMSLMNMSILTLDDKMDDRGGSSRFNMSSSTFLDGSDRDGDKGGGRFNMSSSTFLDRSDRDGDKGGDRFNMSSCTFLDRSDKDEDGDNKDAKPAGDSGRNSETPSPANTPKSIIKPSDPSKPWNMRNRDSRVSFAGKNITLMSLDERSFSQLVDSITDSANSQTGADPDTGAPERSGSQKSATSSNSSLSRKMGFPMRPTVAAKYGAEVPTVKKEEGQEEVDPVGEDYGGRKEKISSLTIDENFPQVGEGRGWKQRSLTSASGMSSGFTKLAGEVEGPGDGAGVENSLKLDMSLVPMSALGLSTMSLESEIDPDLLS
ncbi:hypothetical protein ACHAWF_009583 [Thalassiosira exigua]